jgi:hypothetical protein
VSAQDLTELLGHTGGALVRKFDDLRHGQTIVLLRSWPNAPLLGKWVALAIKQT